MRSSRRSKQRKSPQIKTTSTSCFFADPPPLVKVDLPEHIEPPKPSLSDVEKDALNKRLERIKTAREYAHNQIRPLQRISELKQLNEMLHDVLERDTIDPNELAELEKSNAELRSSLDILRKRLESDH